MTTIDCVLCSEQLQGQDAYTAHLASAHGLVDDSGGGSVAPADMDDEALEQAFEAAVSSAAVPAAPAIPPDIAAEALPAEHADPPTTPGPHTSANEVTPERDSDVADGESAEGLLPDIDDDAIATADSLAELVHDDDDGSPVSAVTDRLADLTGSIKSRFARRPKKERRPSAPPMAASSSTSWVTIIVAVVSLATGWILSSTVNDLNDDTGSAGQAAEVLGEGTDRPEVNNFILESLQIGPAPDGTVGGWAVIRNDEGFSRSAIWKVTVTRGGKDIATLEGAAIAVGPRQVALLAMRSSDTWSGIGDGARITTEFIS